MNTCILLLCTILALGSVAHAGEETKPNIIRILSDDTGYGDLGPYGGGEGLKSYVEHPPRKLQSEVNLPLPTGN